MPVSPDIENPTPCSSLLRIHCFGVFRVFPPGETETVGMVSRHKMWSLFKFLIGHKGTPVCTQELMNLFWPGSNNPDDTATLRTTVSRLKSILEPNSTIYQKSSYLIYSKNTCTFNTNSPFWLDIDEFEKLCGAAHKLGPAQFMGDKKRKMAIDFYFQALDLYQGDFLAEDPDYEWMFIPREHYRRLFLESSLELATWLLEMKDFPRALGVLHKALKLEPYAEELQILLMKAWIAVGDLQAAARHYSECSSRLYNELGIKPSPEWKRLYQQIKETQEDAPRQLILEGNLGPAPRDTGPLVCDPDFFWSLLLFEQRRIARNGGESSLVVLELNSAKGDTDEIKKALEKLESVVYRKLRKCDLVCLIDGRHLALLLYSTGVEGSKVAVAQIHDIFLKQSDNSSLNLQVKIKRVSPFNAGS